MNTTNQFLPPPLVAGRFQSVGVSEFNELGNPTIAFIFHHQGPNDADIRVETPDPGRALITGDATDTNPTAPTFNSTNAFKISSLRGIRHTAPYFHDNSSKTLEDVAAHYARFFQVVTAGAIVLTPQDQADIVAYMKLLD